MTRIIEAKAIISGEDRTGKMFDSLNRNLKNASKNAKFSADIDKLSKSFKGAKDGLAAIDGYRGQRNGFFDARNRMRETKVAVEQASRALANAAKPTKALEQNLRQAQRAADDATKSYERQKTAVLNSRGELTRNGVAVSSLIAEHTRLGKAIDQGSAALERRQRIEQRNTGRREVVRQMRAEREASRAEAAHNLATARANASGTMLRGMGGAGRRQSETVDTNRRLIDGMGAPGRAARAERERHEQEQADLRAQRRSDRRDAAGSLAAGAGLYVGHKGKEIGLEAIKAAAEMDYAIRYQHVATDVSEARQQSLLLPQAKRIGQETRFSNLDVVKAQTTTMQGLPYNDPDMKARVGAAIVDEARNYAVLFESTLTSGSEGLRSFLQTTNKDISTPEKAQAEARRGSNLIVKAAKLGGMNDDDAQQFIKYALPTATQAGFSDVTTMALGALARRSGLRGDEAGVFMRSASSKLISPTKEGREAEIVAGIDRSKYQKMPEQLSAEAFEKIGKGRFGVHFNANQRGRLGTMFRDGDLLQDQGEFTKRVSDVVSESFEKKKNGKLKAQDAAKIAKLANDFYKMSVESTDVEGLLMAHMNSPTFTAALRNKFYTDKHGGKAGILANHFDQLKNDRAELEHVTETPDFASSRAKYMTQGLGGAIDNLKGSFETAVLNLGTANAPAIQVIADGLAAVGDSIANLPEHVIQAGTALALLGGGAGTAASAMTIMGKLTGSTALASAGAGLASATFVGAPLALGTIGGAGLDMATPGTSAGIGSLLFGGESSLEQTNRALRAEREAAGVGLPDAWSRNGGKTLPGADGGTGYSSGYETSRGAFGDFLYGKERSSMVLPTFGLGAKGMPGAPLPETQGPRAPSAIPLPPARPPDLEKLDLSGQIRAINNTLEKAATASATAANGGKPIEATVKPDQITAKVTEIAPVTGEATVTVDNHHQITVTLNTDMLDAKVNAAAGRAVAKIPLSSSGARAGAVSMPGAATTPGAAK